MQDMIKTINLDMFIFDYIDPWAVILSSVVWTIQGSYHSTLQSTPTQLVIRRDMLFNMKKAINRKLMTDNKRKQITSNNKQKCNLFGNNS